MMRASLLGNPVERVHDRREDRGLGVLVKQHWRCGVYARISGVQNKREADTGIVADG